eukprot:5586226-Amphidinium_carterae.1
MHERSNCGLVGAISHWEISRPAGQVVLQYPGPEPQCWGVWCEGCLFCQLVLVAVGRHVEAGTVTCHVAASSTVSHTTCTMNLGLSAGKCNAAASCTGSCSEGVVTLGCGVCCGGSRSLLAIARRREMWRARLPLCALLVVPWALAKSPRGE